MTPREKALEAVMLAADRMAERKHYWIRSGGGTTGKRDYDLSKLELRSAIAAFEAEMKGGEGG